MKLGAERVIEREGERWEDREGEIYNNNNNNNRLLWRLYPQEPELRGATKQNQ